MTDIVADKDTLTVRQHLQDEFISNVTLHGFRYLFIPGRVRRFAWWCCFVGAGILAVYLFHGVLTDYFEYNSFTVNRVDFDVGKLDFPTLTFCYHKPFTSRRFATKPFNLSSAQLQTLYNNVFVKNDISNDTKQVLNHLARQKITSYEDILKIFTATINETLEDNASKSFDYWGSRTCIFNSKMCSADDFKITLDRVYSPCIQYNPYSPIRPSKFQQFYYGQDGFQMYFNLHNIQSLGKDDHVRGMTVYIDYRGRPHQKPFPVEIILQSGVLTKVSMQGMKMTKLLPPPHGKCGERKYKVLKNFPYSYPMCRFECSLRETYNVCGCIGFEYKEFIGDIPVCDIKQMAECYTSRKNKVKNKLIKSKAGKCMRECVQECVQYKYPMRIETLKLGIHTEVRKMRRLMKWTKKKKTDNEIKKYIEENIVGVRIAYSDIVEKREITTPSVTLTTLLGTIGGSIGLGLGFSVLTLVEFIFFILEYLCYPLMVKKNNDNKAI